MKLHSRPAGHFYTEKKLLFPSVTTILGCIPNPGLEAWKRSVPNWRKISAAACKTGTEVHKEVEHIVMGKRPKIKHSMQIDAFLEWQKQTGFRCLKTELKVRSRKGFAGSLDLLGEIDDKMYIIDIKTSKQIYPEMLLQLSAYKYAFLEKNTLFDVNIAILRLDKAQPELEWRAYTDEEYEEGITAFLKLCAEWHYNHSVQKEYNKNFILED